MIPTLFFIALIVFTLAHLAPGSPFDKNENRPLPQATIDRLNSIYGIDKPLPEQFVMYLGNLARLDLGSSLVKDRTVADIISSQFPVSAQLGVQATLLALAVALPLGVVSALKQNTGVDYASLFFATVGRTVPSFVIAIFAIYLFGVTLKWLPFVGWGNGCGPLPSCDVKRMLLPTIILALGETALLTRITRASMLEAIRQDYVRTARSKGLREQVVIVTHTMKNAMIPVATVIGPATAGLITGSFLIETLFNVPGLGREFVLSINRRDYPLIMGVYMLYASLIVVANLTVDLVYGWLDPRIKLGR
jgi:ABC-type dipeptide/oligopeptide/nickel transport system permease component